MSFPSLSQTDQQHTKSHPCHICTTNTNRAFCNPCFIRIQNATKSVPDSVVQNLMSEINTRNCNTVQKGNKRSFVHIIPGISRICEIPVTVILTFVFEGRQSGSPLWYTHMCIQLDTNYYKTGHIYCSEGQHVRRRAHFDLVSLTREYLVVLLHLEHLRFSRYFGRFETAVSKNTDQTFGAEVGFIESLNLGTVEMEDKCAVCLLPTLSRFLVCSHRVCMPCSSKLKMPAVCPCCRAPLDPDNDDNEQFDDDQESDASSDNGGDNQESQPATSPR